MSIKNVLPRREFLRNAVMLAGAGVVANTMIIPSFFNYLWQTGMSPDDLISRMLK